MRVEPLHHLAVCTTDLSASMHFYVEVLGLPIVRRWTREDGSLRSLWLDLGPSGEGSAFLAVEEVTGGPLRADASAGWHCVALGIRPSDRASWAAHLARAGYPVERETDHTLYVRDPGGALVGLSHYPAEAGASVRTRT